MIERILDNATDTSIKADQSLAKADYINMWHLLPLADPGPELPLQLLSPKRSAKVFHLALCVEYV